MDIVEKLNNVKKTALSDMSVVYYNKIAPLVKERDYLRTTTGWVYACTSVIADELAKIRLRLYRKKGVDTEEIFNHPILDLLHRANDFTTKYDLFWLTAQYLELAGEAPWFVFKKNGMPVGLYLLRPDKISIRAGTGDRFIDGYTYRNDKGKEVYIKPDEMIFNKIPNTINPFRGMGTLQAAARVVDIEEYSEEFNRNYFVNSAMPSMFFSTDQKLGEEKKDRFRKSIEKNYTGIKNAQKFLILEAGLEAKPLQMTQRDMEFIEQLRWTRDKILGIFRVPRTALGITDDVNRANAEATDYVFAKRTIQPKMERLIQQLNEFLVPMFPDGKNLLIGYESPVPEDTEKKLKYYESGIRNGFLTINEVRRKEGDEPIGEDGDQVLISSTLKPIGEKPAIIPSKDILHKINTRNKLATRGASKKKVDDIIMGSVKEVEGDIRGLVKFEEERRDKLVMQWSDVEIKKSWASMTKRSATYTEKFTKLLKLQFKHQIKNILLRHKDITSGWKIDVDQERAVWFKVFMPLYEEIVKGEGQKVLNELIKDGKFSDMTDTSQRFIHDKTAKMSWEINKTTNRKIEKIVNDNIGENVKVVSAKMTDLFDNMEKSRVDIIARTEVAKAINFATEESYRQSGVVEAKKWVTGRDNRVCEFCRELEGKIIGLNENFENRGANLEGEDEGIMDIDYENISAPPLHASCRCGLVPIIVGQKQFNNIIKNKQ